MDTKSLTVQVKDADQGTVEAVFSTFNVRDSDGDVTLPGAFTDGAEVIISAYGHTSWDGLLPVGKGVIRQTGEDARLLGQFFLDTSAGRDTFATVKQLGTLGQWSYGYDIPAEGYSYGEHEGRKARFLKALTVHEVSPVLLGAGVGTRTVNAKSNRTFAEEGEAVLTALAAFGMRAADVMAMRAEKGKALSVDSAGLVARVEAELKKLAEVLAAEPEPTIPEVTAAYLRHVARSHL